MRVIFIRLDSPLFIRSVPVALPLNHLVQYLKLVEGPLKLRCEGAFPGKAASWNFLRVAFRLIFYSCSFSPVPVLIEAALCLNTFMIRVMSWLICRKFQYFSSFDPHCAVFSGYRLVCCRFCLQYN